MKKLVLLAFVLSGCSFYAQRGEQGATGAVGSSGPAGQTGSQGNQGAAGEQGSQGVQGIQGAPGVNGTNGTDGTNGSNGANGINGTDGINGSIITAEQFCGNITPSYPSTFPELGLCIDNQLYAIYSANGGFLVLLTPGTYSSDGINASCTFTVVEGCVIK